MLWITLLLLVLVSVEASFTSLHQTRSILPNQRPLTYCPARTAKSLVSNGGNPCVAFTPNCGTRATWTVSSKNVGPFTVRGFAPALDALARVFSKVQSSNPALYNAVSTAGMACCRCVRRSSGRCSSSWSNHAFGMAIDLKLNGRLDTWGDFKTQDGLLKLFPFFKSEGFYWGAGFSKEDSMHFEIAKQTVERWQAGGTVSTPVNTGSVNTGTQTQTSGGNAWDGVGCSRGSQSGRCGDASTCRSNGGTPIPRTSGCFRFPTAVQCCVGGSSPVSNTGNQVAFPNAGIPLDPNVASTGLFSQQQNQQPSSGLFNFLGSAGALLGGNSGAAPQGQVQQRQQPGGGGLFSNFLSNLNPWSSQPQQTPTQTTVGAQPTNSDGDWWAFNWAFVKEDAQDGMLENSSTTLAAGTMSVLVVAAALV